MAVMTGAVRLHQVERKWLRERVPTRSVTEALRAVIHEARGRDGGYLTLVEARRGLEFGQLLDMKWSSSRV